MKTDTWLRGDWMQTFTGKAFYPLDPKVEDISIVDIAHALSLLCRYGGHVRRFYSVAEHCYLMSEAVPREHALWALLHDATEAYVGDMVRPLKHQLPDYMAVEDRIMALIATRFGLSGSMPAEVKDADNRILVNEREALMATPPIPWHGHESLPPLPVNIWAWRPEHAEYMYLRRFKELTA